MSDYENTEVPTEVHDAHIEISPEAADLYGALAKAQGEFAEVKKTATVDYQPRNGPRVSYNYAPLSELRKATAKQLAANGLCVVHLFHGDLTSGHARMTTMLGHSSGQSIKLHLAFQPQASIKELGGQTTYLRRYAYQCLLNLEGEENAEEGELTQPTARTEPPQRRKPDVFRDVLQPARRDAGLGDVHVQAISRSVFGVATGQLEDSQARAVARIIKAATSSEIGRIKDTSGDGFDSTVAAIKDRLAQQKAASSEGGA